MNNNGIRNYQRANVITADPKRLVLMCYEGAIDSLKVAKKKIIEKDYEGKSKALAKAQDIINELSCSLDFEKGGSISRNLYSLYNYMLRMILLQGDLKKDISAIDDIVGMLEELKSAWEEIFYKQTKYLKSKPVEMDENRRQVSGYAGLRG